jgi:hypothetical protein
MTTSLDPPPPDRLRQFAVPAVLIVVACIQIYLAKTHDLTPWKGGGFGMFSTVDDAQARWIRCYAITNGRETPAGAPDQFGRAIARLRAMPSQDKLQQLADDYGRMRFVNDSFDQNIKAERKQNADPIAAGDGQAAAAPPATGARAAPFLRVWEPDEREPKPSELVAVESVRVEFWRWRFDLPSRKMLAWKAAEASAPASREGAR